MEIQDLATLALPTSDDRQISAENEFFANAENVIDAQAWKEFQQFALKATTEERIAEALRLTEANPA